MAKFFYFSSTSIQKSLSLPRIKNNLRNRIFEFFVLFCDDTAHVVNTIVLKASVCIIVSAMLAKVAYAAYFVLLLWLSTENGEKETRAH